MRRDLKKENLLVRACTDDKSEYVHNITRKNCVIPEEVRFNLYMYLNIQLKYLYKNIVETRTEVSKDVSIPVTEDMNLYSEMNAELKTVVLHSKTSAKSWV